VRGLKRPVTIAVTAALLVAGSRTAAASPVQEVPATPAPEASAPAEADAETDADADADTEAAATAEPPPATESSAAVEPSSEVDGARATPGPAPQFGKDPPSATAEPAPIAEPSLDTPPGGYWGPTDTKELPPSDGRRKILIGSILAPLGALATASGGAFTYLTVPGHCVERLAGVGIETTGDRCKGLFTLNIIRTTYGGLMLITGTVFVVLGLRERDRRREWDSHHTAARPRPRRFRFEGASIRF